MAVMANPDSVRVFAKFVRLEGELSTLLRDRLERDRAMLREMGGSPA
jgi:hypothetical protein